VKTIIFIRHGERAGELIAPSQLMEIEDQGIKGLNDLKLDHIILCLGTGLERTQQTILAFKAYMESWGCQPNAIFAADNRFGNAELFKRMADNSALMEEQKKSGWYNAMKIWEPELLHNIQVNEYEALGATFDEMENDDLAISSGHTPLIEFLAIFVSPDGPVNSATNLKELQGVKFQEDFNGYITAVEIIG
jgi:hypothetical protein